MGNQQSGPPRTVTVDNNTPIGVVDVSDAVVQRLKGQHAKDLKNRKQQANEDQKSDQSSVDNQQDTRNIVPVTVVHSGQKPSAYYGEPTITAIDVRRQKDIELYNNDLYWAKRLAQQEQAHQKSNAISEKEFTAAAEDVRKRFENVQPQHQLPPCRKFKENLIECYKRNPKETLICVQEVADFTHCVNANRIKLLDEKANPEKK